MAQGQEISVALSIAVARRTLCNPRKRPVQAHASQDSPDFPRDATQASPKHVGSARRCWMLISAQIANLCLAGGHNLLSRAASRHMLSAHVLTSWLMSRWECENARASRLHAEVCCSAASQRGRGQHEVPAHPPGGSNRCHPRACRLQLPGLQAWPQLLPALQPGGHCHSKSGYGWQPTPRYQHAWPWPIRPGMSQLPNGPAGDCSAELHADHCRANACQRRCARHPRAGSSISPAAVFRRSRIQICSRY